MMNSKVVISGGPNADRCRYAHLPIAAMAIRPSGSPVPISITGKPPRRQERRYGLRPVIIGAIRHPNNQRAFRAAGTRAGRARLPLPRAARRAWRRAG